MAKFDMTSNSTSLLGATTVPENTAKPVKSNTSALKKLFPSRRNLRNLELGFIILGIVISTIGLLAVQIGTSTGQSQTGFGGDIKLSSRAFIGGGLFWLLVLTLHVLLRFKAKNADPLIVPVCALLNTIGLLMIYRIDLASANSGSGSANYAEHQLIWSYVAVIMAGVVVLFIRDYLVLRRFTYLFMIAGIVLLVMPMIPHIGTSNGTNAKLWVSIGPLSFQPSEYAKLAMAIFFAGFLAQQGEAIAVAGRKIIGLTFPRARDFGPILVVWALAMCVLVFQKDLGTSLMYFGLFLVMLYAATGLISWVIIGLVMFAVGSVAITALTPLVQDRVSAWLNPLDPSVYNKTYGSSYQIVQGLFGQAHGGLFGTGWGRGYPQLTPLARSDYIFTSVSEEIGLIGIFAILVLMLILVERGFRVGLTASDSFGRLLAIGLSFGLALQIFTVIGGVTRVIPLTGLPTPFMAAGGSSLMANWIIFALFLKFNNAVPSESSGLARGGAVILKDTHPRQLRRRGRGGN